MQRDEFFEKLLETFQIEAGEHVEAMTAGLVELERGADPASRGAILEDVFREAHSLKGAARAVDRLDIESLCQSLETSFASLKRGECDFSPELFDLLHRSVDRVRALLGAATAPTPAPEPAPRPAPAPAPVRQAPVSAAPPRLGVAASQVAAPATPPPGPKAPDRRAAPDTIRVAASKLDDLLLQAEEMVAVKLTAGQRAADLRAVESILEEWKKTALKKQPDLRFLRQALDRKDGKGAEAVVAHARRLVEFVDWNQGCVAELETRVQALTRSAEHDQRSFGGMVDELLEDMKKSLMQPLGSLFVTLPKMVRDLARDQGKDVDLDLEGADVEVDRRILESLKDPLMHLVRNAVDHGIEPPDVRQRNGKPARARIAIRASQVEGSAVEIGIADDGAGIDPARVRAAAVKRRLLSAEESEKLDDAASIALIFKSDLSTSPIVTDLSGRGLGLAIVRQKAEALGGTVVVQSQPGTGTTFRLRLPLTLATFRGILVRSAGETYVIPTANVERVTRVQRDSVRRIEGRQVVVLEGRTLALASLDAVLGLRPKADTKSPFVQLVVLGSGDQRIAFAVDEVLREQEVLVKSLGKCLVRVRNVAGATVLGNGRAVCILCVPDLLQSASSSASRPAGEPASEGGPVKGRHSVLVAEDSITSRMLLKNILESAGYDVKTAVDGVEALEALRAGKFDLVVSDVEMPRLDGFALTASIRADKRLSETPVVLVTSLKTPEARQRGIEVGADAYIVKSTFDQGNLLDVMQNLL